MSQSEDVTKRLRAMILSMELGPGEPLTERWAEAYFSASRTPVRTAFQKLEAEKLLQRDGKRWMVSPIRTHELKQLYYYREVLELAALESSAELLTEDKLKNLENILDKHQTDKLELYEDVGTQFHLKLASLCGNKYIISGLEDTLRQLYRVRWLEMSPDNPALTDHHEILSALRSNDLAKASRILKSHLQEGCERLIKAVNSNKRSLRASGIKIE